MQSCCKLPQKHFRQRVEIQYSLGAADGFPILIHSQKESHVHSGNQNSPPVLSWEWTLQTSPKQKPWTKNNIVPQSCTILHPQVASWIPFNSHSIPILSPLSPDGPFYPYDIPIKSTMKNREWKRQGAVDASLETWPEVQPQSATDLFDIACVVKCCKNRV